LRGSDAPRGVSAAAERAQAFRPWNTSLLEGVESSTGFCSYAGAALYCTGPGVKAARLNPADGAISWSVKASDSTRRAEERSVPALSGGLLLVVEPGGTRLEALDPDSGRKRWEAGISAYSEIRHTDSTVLLFTADGTAKALNSATGKQRWTKRIAAPGSQWISTPGGGPAFAVTPSGDATATTVRAFDPEHGTVLWKIRLHGSLTRVGTSDQALFLLSEDHSALTTAIVRLDTITRTARRIPLAIPVDQAQATVSGDTVYVFGAGGALIALDTSRTGNARSAQRWRLETSVSRASRPVAAGGRVYLTAADGRLLAVDGITGSLLGQTEPRMDGGQYTFTPTLPAPVAAGGRVFATAPDGSVFAVDARDPAAW